MGLLCVILAGFLCSKSRFTPLQAEEMGFLPQPRALALKLDGYFPIQKSGLGIFLDQHLIHVNSCFPIQKSGLGFFLNQHLIQLNSCFPIQK